MTILQSKIQCPDPPRVPLATFVLEEAEKHGEKVAFIDPLTKEEFTFRTVALLAKNLAASLQSHGVSYGDRVAFCTSNSVQACIALLAVSRCGATVTLANPLYTERELDHFIHVAEPTHWFCLPAVLPRLTSLKTCKKVFIFGSIDSGDYISYQQLLESQIPEFVHPTVDFENDVATLPFSSGTTGLPKGVMLTHKNVVTALVQTRSWLEDLGPKDTSVLFLPLFHQYGLMTVLHCVMHGVKLIVMPRFSLPDLLQHIQTYKVTAIPMVPPVAVQLAKNPIVDNYDVSSLKCIINSAAALTLDVTKLITKRLGVKVKQGYGMTEATFAVLYSTGHVEPGAIGRLLPFLEAKVMDLETNAAVGPNQDGEIAVRGPLVMKGYRHNEEETRNSIDEEGWLRTGDIGCFDESGCFWYKDRKKELIKYNAYQVPPAELEGLLVAHPTVADAAVIGIPDELAGELPRAYVVKRQDAEVTAEELIDYVANNVAPFKKLRGGVVFVDSVPRSLSGKILRRELKAQLLKETDDLKKHP